VTRPSSLLLPLVLATMASQALLVVLSPTILAIGDDLDASVSAIGQARSVTALVAIASSVFIAGRIARIGVPRLLAVGASLAVVACIAVASAQNLWTFLAAHVLVGVAFACLLSGGFAGVAAFAGEQRAWAIGYVAGANALAWIVVNPAVGALTQRVSWRVAEVVPAALALAALLTARNAAPVPEGAAAPRLRGVLADESARRWIGSELIAYGAWTGLLTFAGAFFIHTFDVSAGAAGWLLAAGAAAYFAAAMRSARFVARFPRRHLVALSALAMAALLPLLLGDTRSLAWAAILFCAVGVAAGVRTPASSGLGLAQLPEHPGTMMAARTGATQVGYLVGAAFGGVVIAGAGYAALSLVLAAGMALSALLVLRVRDDASVPAMPRDLVPSHGRVRRGSA
jgi:predicted MFS family arabinose efflux permease